MCSYNIHFWLLSFLYSSNCASGYYWLHADQRRRSNWCLRLHPRGKEDLSEKVSRVRNLSAIVVRIIIPIRSPLPPWHELSLSTGFRRSAVQAKFDQDFLKARFLLVFFFFFFFFWGGKSKKTGKKMDFSRQLSAIFFQHVFWSEVWQALFILHKKGPRPH